MFTREELIKDFIEYKNMGQGNSWYIEMMNCPVPGDGGLIRLEEIQTGIERLPGEIPAAFITIDPAISLKKKSDKSAVVVHGLVDNRAEVLEYVHEKMDPLDTINHTLDLCHKWGTNVIGIESNAYQASLKFWFNIEPVSYTHLTLPTKRIV